MITARALVALGAALVLASCSHGAAPPSRVSHNPQTDAKVRGEIKTGVRAYGHHAYKIALAHFNSALKLDPASLEARYDRGITEEDLHAYGRGAADLARVVHEKPAWPGARVHLAAAEFHAKNYAAASRDFDIALRSNGKSWKVWLDDGVSYYKTKRYAEARKRFARALSLSPRSGRAHFWLGMTYSHLHNKHKALTELALAAHSRDTVVRTAARHQLTGK